MCNAMFKRPVLFLAVYTLQGSSNVGQFTGARTGQFVPESMQCCLKGEDHWPGQELVYSISVSKSSPKVYALKHEQPSAVDAFVWGPV